MDVIKRIQDEINQYNRSLNNADNIDIQLTQKSNQMTIKSSRKNSPNNSQQPKIYNHPQKRKIVQYTKEGEFIREFESIAEANRYFNLSDKYISKHLRGYTKTCLGFVFKFNVE